MNKVLIIGIILSMASCKKHEKVNKQDVSTFDVSEIINSDDYFGLKPKDKEPKREGLTIELMQLNDINGDGIKDSVWIKHNEHNHVYTLNFSCYPDFIQIDHMMNVQIKDMNDLNGDQHHELMLFLQSDESCWDEIRLFSWTGKWEEKYKGLTYQCSETNQYQFRKLDDKTIQLTTYGVNRDSIDLETGDTLEYVVPNAENVHLIEW
ncbi:MAG: hypothetical protein R2852_06495 [Bacteroidia bacterium]